MDFVNSAYKSLISLHKKHVQIGWEVAANWQALQNLHHACSLPVSVCTAQPCRSLARGRLSRCVPRPPHPPESLPEIGTSSRRVSVKEIRR